MLGLLAVADGLWQRGTDCSGQVAQTADHNSSRWSNMNQRQNWNRNYTHDSKSQWQTWTKLTAKDWRQHNECQVRLALILQRNELPSNADQQSDHRQKHKLNTQTHEPWRFHHLHQRWHILPRKQDQIFHLNNGIYGFKPKKLYINFMTMK